MFAVIAPEPFVLTAAPLAKEGPVGVLNLYFGWPAGAVYSNLLASAICAGLVWWRLRARMIAHHAEALAQAARHHAERLRQADEHHDALKAHLTAAVRAPKTLTRKPAKEAGG
jgi:hypothetical protein